MKCHTCKSLGPQAALLVCIYYFLARTIKRRSAAWAFHCMILILIRYNYFGHKQEVFEGGDDFILLRLITIIAWTFDLSALDLGL